jgi:MinD-like ATPase involved in chromosome partitioning or flagellar assembly
MEQVSMNDGLDGRETVAFGLAAGEVAVFVLSLMTAYAALRSGLPGAVGWCLAAVLGVGGAALAWGRLAGRPLLEWAALLARFAVRTRHARVAPVRQRCRLPRRRGQAGRGPVVVAMALRRHEAAGRAVVAPSGSPQLSLVDGVHRTRLAATGTAGGAAREGRGHVVVFFSLNGGTGRTTLAVELATLLAVRGRAAAASGSWGERVALLDLTERSPTVGLRLGIPIPVAAGVPPGTSLLTHESGLLVLAASPAERSGAAAGAAWVRAALAAAERAGAGLVVVDIDCDLGPRCLEVLRRCDEVHVTVAPTAVGVLDSYRSTAALRRLGLRHRIGYVVNRWHEGADLAEAMADLGGSIGAAIPDDDALVRAETSHRAAGLDAGTPVARALLGFAEAVESAALRGRPAAQPWADSDAG